MSRGRDRGPVPSRAGTGLRSPWPLLLLLLLMLLASPAAVLGGTVTDGDGGVLAEVAIELRLMPGPGPMPTAAHQWAPRAAGSPTASTR